MYSIQWTDKKPKTFGVIENGDYNHCPQPVREITQHEFVHAMSVYMPQFIDNRQVHDLPGFENQFSDLTLFFFHNAIIGVRKPNKWTLEDNKITYTEPTKFYQFGCEHENMERTNVGNCLNRYYCKKCGYEEEIDSSD